jgi:hypothetical protein
MAANTGRAKPAMRRRAEAEPAWKLMRLVQSGVMPGAL